MDVNGKRLLILGGTRLMVHVVETAKKMGVYTVVTDMDPNSPAKRVADKSYNISTSKIDDVVSMAIEERIEGIFVGYDDQNTGYAVDICNKLGIRFYATKEQIEITKNKISFKDTCRSFSVPVVQEYELDTVVFPCVVKPADSYSAKGITICYNREELSDAIEFAKQFSKTDQFLIEKYMDYTNSDCVNIDYLLIDGKIYLTMVGDKLVVKQGNKAPLTDAVVYPSEHVREYIKDVDEKVKKMFMSLGMRNGTVFIESFYDKSGFAIYEMGYRVGGGQSSILLNDYCGIDYVELLINYTLTGKMTDRERLEIDPSMITNCCGMVVLVKPGTIDSIVGIDEVKKIPEVISITQYLYIGDTVDKKYLGTLGQTFSRIHIKSDSKESLVKTMKNIKNMIHVYDSDRNDLVVRGKE